MDPSRHHCLKYKAHVCAIGVLTLVASTRMSFAENDQAHKGF